MIPLTLKNPLVWLLLISMATGCARKKKISGSEFIDQEVLVDVLVDIHLIDGVTNDRRFHRRYEADSIDMLSPILEKHGVTHEMFDTTMAEYSRYPELLDEVYSEVLIRLNIMLDENENTEE